MRNLSTILGKARSGMIGLLLLTQAFAQTSVSDSIVLYCSQDQVVAEPVIKEFERRSGFIVKAVYDSEALKTASLANRLRAEKSNPRCDVFWSNEELLARTLEAEGITRTHARQGPAGVRSRVIVVPESLPADLEPKSFRDLTNSRHANKLAMAYPLYGTTAHQMARLRQLWGDGAWEAWCEGLRANKARVVDGNSTVVRLVAHGQAQVGMTDSDDVRAGIAEGWKVRAIQPLEDGLKIRNTVALLRNAPHLKEAGILADYLCSAAVSEALIKSGALDPDVASTPQPAGDWAHLLKNWPDTRSRLEKGFSR